MAELKDVIIIGGGASGLFAACLISGKGKSVLLLEKNKVLGKKLALTGNGRCNYTNLYQNKDCYFSEDREKAFSIISSFNQDKIMDYLSSLGILPDVRRGRFASTEEVGYVYPYSGSGKDFVSVLQSECEARGVKIKTNTEVKDIKKTAEGFSVITGDNSYAYEGKEVLVTTGGLALPSSGSDGSLNSVLKKVFRFKTEVPALTYLKHKNEELKKLSGLRLEAFLRLYSEHKLLSSERGELQFSEKGLSGIPVMQLSGLAARELLDGRKAFLSIDFFPASKEKDFFLYLKERRKALSHKRSSDFFLGLFPEKLASLFLSPYTKIDKSVSDFSEETLASLAKTVKDFPLPITGTGDFQSAQTTSGGLLLSELDDFLQSKCLPGLFFAGELLDVDGSCGGYNLTWAFASAHLVSEKIGEMK